MKACERLADWIGVRAIPRILIGLFAVMVGLSSPSSALVHAPGVVKPPQAPEMRLSGERIVLPIVMVREFPFIEGSIAGVKGKLMLDTGHRKALAINDRRVPVVNPVSSGRGLFGSGQTFDIRVVPVVKDIQAGHLRYARVTQVQSQDAAQLERITPDFIGWLGHDFWEGYALKLDYRNSQAIFYRGSTDTYLHGEKIIAELPFESRKLANIPVIKGNIAGIDATVAFDSGQNGTLFIDAETKSLMIAEGALVRSGDGDKYDLHRLELHGTVFDGLKNIGVDTTPFPAAIPTGLTDKTLLTLGFVFLDAYKTVWDSNKKVIYVLER